MKSKRTSTLLPTTYGPWLAGLKDRVRSARLQAAARANQELLRLYWDLGRAIVAHQRKAGWGAAIIPRLAADLHAEFPDMTGFSERNFGRMVAFYREYPGLFAILPPPVAKLVSADAASPTIQRVAPKLPWAHHVILLEKLKARAARAWYMQAAVAHGWSRSVLTAQIAQRAHARAGRAVTNFAATLPPSQSDLAQQTLRDPYLFDFLTLGPAAREHDLERGLATHIQQFLVSLGTGFAFVGRQVHLEVGGQDYYLDLLFYHLRLRCFVVVDLKMDPFQPEFAGKMNFYLSAVDTQMRHRDDQPSLGLLLCQERNQLTVEYALRDLKKPIGVSEWRTRLVGSLPRQLQGRLPSVKELAQVLGRRK